MNDGFYLSAYTEINRFSYVFNKFKRHDTNIALWSKNGQDIELLRYWELERITGQKMHRKPFFSYDHALEVINDLLSEFNISTDDLEGILGTPILDTVHDYSSLDVYPNLSYHSICHLFSALLLDTDVFKNECILALAVDGGPDGLIDANYRKRDLYSASYSEYGEIKDVFSAPSPGPFWGIARDFFEMREGSLMALASACTCELIEYPRPSDLDIYDLTNGTTAINYIYDLYEYVMSLELDDLGTKFKNYDKNFNFDDNRISMAMKLVQTFSKQVMREFIASTIERYNIDPSQTVLAMSGGFGLNCPTNAYLMKEFGFKSFIAPPAISDTGMSLGMGLYYFYRKLDSFNFKFKNAYYGMSDLDMTMLEEYEYYMQSVTDMRMSRVIKDIMIGPIIYFDGCAEIGPRALGHRSIIADPRTNDSKDSLNEIKLRQWWRPVAPILLEEEVNNWFVDAFPSPYMLHTFQIQEDKLDSVPAIRHIDDSARIQTINREQNETLYDIINAFYEETGVPILCNTSLNDKGEPIINTIEELINFALRKGIKIAYINNVRVEFQNHEDYQETTPLKRPVDFNKYQESR